MNECKPLVIGRWNESKVDLMLPGVVDEDTMARLQVAAAAAAGRPWRNMLFLLPKFPVLKSQNSACYARIVPDCVR